MPWDVRRCPARAVGEDGVEAFVKGKGDTVNIEKSVTLVTGANRGLGQVYAGN